jgi:hypothetical protein
MQRSDLALRMVNGWFFEKAARPSGDTQSRLLSFATLAKQAQWLCLLFRPISRSQLGLISVDCIQGHLLNGL